MATNLLTARKVETASAKDKPYWLKDGGSLFLLVQPNSSKLWRYRYRVSGKANMFAIGKFPEVTLEKARADRDAARSLVKKGIHPSIDRRACPRALKSDPAFASKSDPPSWLGFGGIGCWIPVLESI
ncbi:MAG: Arm DNA-binding domain-containing protein [Stenotrophobium sp.]